MPVGFINFEARWSSSADINGYRWRSFDSYLATCWMDLIFRIMQTRVDWNELVFWRGSVFPRNVFWTVWSLAWSSNQLPCEQLIENHDNENKEVEARCRWDSTAEFKAQNRRRAYRISILLLVYPAKQTNKKSSMHTPFTLSARQRRTHVFLHSKLSQTGPLTISNQYSSAMVPSIENLLFQHDLGHLALGCAINEICQRQGPIATGDGVISHFVTHRSNSTLAPIGCAEVVVELRRFLVEVQEYVPADDVVLGCEICPLFVGEERKEKVQGVGLLVVFLFGHRNH